MTGKPPVSRKGIYIFKGVIFGDVHKLGPKYYHNESNLMKSVSQPTESRKSSGQSLRTIYSHSPASAWKNTLVNHNIQKYKNILHYRH